MMAAATGIRQVYHQLSACAGDEVTVSAAGSWLHAMLAGTVAQTCPPVPAGPEVLPLLPGCWLQSVLHAGNAEQAIVLALHQIYRHCQSPDSPAFHYRQCLARAGITVPATDSLVFASDERWPDVAFEKASLALALGLNAYAYLPEACGFTLAWADMLGAEEATAAHHGWMAILGEQLQILRDVMPESDVADADWNVRVASGRLLAAWCLPASVWHPVLRTDQSHDTDAVRLMATRAVHARGYHRKVRLGGRCLDDWFHDQPFRAQPFREALRISPWMKAGEDSRCPFERLTAFGGPMFGVFTPDEVSLITDWVHGAGEDSAMPELPSATGRLQGFRQTHRSLLETDGLAGWRGRYHRLLNPQRYDGLDRMAYSVVHRMLALTPATSLRRRYRSFVYSPEALHHYVQNLHQREVARYRPLKGKPRLSRESCVLGIRQMAPAILLDGCWLQGLQQVSLQQRPDVSRLMRIHDDELGAGVRAQHHPLIYRELLASVDLHYPEVASIAFAAHEDFSTAAFVLPVYLLAVAKGGLRYYPEVLGLNLAIELGGLGAEYMGLVDTLRYWQLDPLIVQLHLSIDNLASGHAAMAVDAIILHLDEVARTLGQAAVQAEWQRIWAGYRSLPIASMPIAASLVSRVIFS